MWKEEEEANGFLFHHKSIFLVSNGVLSLSLSLSVSSVCTNISLLTVFASYNGTELCIDNGTYVTIKYNKTHTHTHTHTCRGRW